MPEGGERWKRKSGWVARVRNFDDHGAMVKALRSSLCEMHES